MYQLATHYDYKLSRIYNLHLFKKCSQKRTKEEKKTAVIFLLIYGCNVFSTQNSEKYTVNIIISLSYVYFSFQ